MKREWFVIIVLFLVIVVLIGSVGLTGLNVLFALGDQGGKINYAISDVEDFVQCFDADPQNINTIKSVCHAQYYLQGESSLRGMNAVDFCKSPDEVVDFYCGKDFRCWELVSECDDGFVCEDGSCVKKRNELLKIFDFKEVGDSFSRMFG